MKSCLSIVSSNCCRWMLWGIIALVFSLGMPLSPLTLQCPIIDSAIFLTCARWMQDGLVMYRDMFDHKGPMIYVFDMLGLSLGLTGVWLLCIFWSVLTTHVVYLICRVYSNEKSSFIASVYFLLMTIVMGGDNTVELVAMPFVAFAMYVLLCPIHERRKVPSVSVFFASTCLAVIFLLKPNIGAGVAFLAMLVLIDLIRHFSLRRFGLYLLSFLMGFAIVFVPLYFWLDYHHAWHDYMTTFWKFNMEYSSNMEFSTKIANLFRLSFLYIPSFVSWCFIAVCVVAERNTLKRTENLWLLAMLLFTCYVSSGLSGFPFVHYLLPVFVIYAVFIAKAIGCIRPKYNNVVYGILVLWCGYFGYKQYVGYKIINGSYTKVNVAVAEYVKANTKEDDRICLYDVDTTVYLLSNRKSVTKYIYQFHIFRIRPSLYNDFIHDICSKKPSLLLVGINKTLPASIAKLYRQKETIGNGIKVFVLK